MKMVLIDSFSYQLMNYLERIRRSGCVEGGMSVEMSF